MASVRHNRTELMKINMGALTRDMLEDLVNEGDVQTACTMLLVLEKKLTKTIDPMSLGEIEINWFHSYIDLLSRFRLWTVLAAVVAQAPDPIKVRFRRILVLWVLSLAAAFSLPKVISYIITSCTFQIIIVYESFLISSIQCTDKLYIVLH